MAAEQALQELLDVSEEIEAAVVFDREGAVLASSVDAAAAAAAAAIAGATLSYSDSLRAGRAAQRIEAVTRDGGVFLLRDDNGAIVAIAARDALRGLVLHDLRACLRKSAKRTREKASA